MIRGRLVSCEVVHIYSYLKSRWMSDVKFAIGNEKLPKKFNKTNQVNNAASKKSRAPTTSANGVQFVDKKSYKR